MASEQAFLKHLLRVLDYWSETASESFTNPGTDLSWAQHPEAFRHVASCLQTAEDRHAFALAIREVLFGQMHSTLVVLDGGSALAEETTLTITDETGEEYPGGLHELFAEHAVKSEPA